MHICYNALNGCALLLHRRTSHRAKISGTKLNSTAKDEIILFSVCKLYNALHTYTLADRVSCTPQSYGVTVPLESSHVTTGCVCVRFGFAVYSRSGNNNLIY